MCSASDDSAKRFTVMKGSRLLGVTAALVAATCAPLVNPAAFEANSSNPDVMPTVVPATVSVIVSEIAPTQGVYATDLPENATPPASQTPEAIAQSAGGSTARTVTETQPIPNGPILLRSGLQLRKVAEVGTGNIRLVHNPLNGEIYFLNPSEGVLHVDLATGSTDLAAVLADITGGGTASGMAFGPDGSLYIVSNQPVERKLTRAIVRKGVPDAAGQLAWSTFATTAPYELSGTNFDHLFNGIAVSEDNQWIYLNSGSRTDHGEVENNNYSFPKLREVALTAKIFRIPASGLVGELASEEVALEAQNVIFARGTRNSYDLEFAPNGELFGGDNGPDADYPDELNWLREGLHYGFPWRFGTQDNPQQFPNYDSMQDKRLNPDFAAVQRGTYHIDVNFPAATLPFTDPIGNRGPDAAQYRDESGGARDSAAEGKLLSTFTPHRSPLGLVFSTSTQMPMDFRGDGQNLSAFILSWGAAGGTLTDKGRDLLHLSLARNGDNYQVVSNQIARGFNNPIDAVLIDNRLYILEFGAGGVLWEITIS